MNPVLSAFRAGGPRFASTYIRPGNRTALPRRRSAKLRLGETRPAVYYKFDQIIELSDGSTINRRTVSPQAEIRMMNDARNAVRWNPSLPDIGAILQDSTGKLAKFRRRFAELDSAQEVTASSATNAATADSAQATTMEEVPNDSEEALDDMLSSGADSSNLSKLQVAKKRASKKKRK